MLKKSFLFLFSLLVMGLSTSFGHAIWIETASHGKADESQDIKVYFGEFATEDISQVSEWFSDLSAFELLWVKPDGTTEVLPVSANGNHFISSFTPKGEGLHRVLLQKTASELSYGYKLSYMAAAHVKVGETGENKSKDVLPVALKMTTLKGKVGQAFSLQHIKDAALKGEEEITVVSPNSWTKRLYADDEGNLQFTPLWPGKYLIETTVTDKNKGAFNGKPYEVAFNCHTFVVEVE